MSQKEEIEKHKIHLNLNQTLHIFQHSIYKMHLFYSIKYFPWAGDYRVFYLQFILKLILYSVKSGLMLDI